MSEMAARSLRIGLLWRSEWDPVVRGRPIPGTCRLHGVFEAFSALGIDAERLVYSDGNAYVLCEINASSTFAFPEFAMPAVARAALAQIRAA